MQPVVFSAAWFARHQRTLLWMLHAPVIGRWFRWVLCIRPHDVGYRQRMVQLLPHAYTVANDDGTLTTDFRTHAKYAKRLYYAFKPVWWTLHAWDLVVANPLVPSLNAGFDTLTVYPDPGDPGTTTCDGYTRRDSVDEAWATIRAGAGTSAGAGDTVWPLCDIRASATANQWQLLGRSDFLFDTSSIGIGTVTAGTLSLYGDASQTFDNLAVAPNIDIYSATTASNATLAASDFSTVGTASFTGAPIAYASWNGAGYNDFALNASGRAAIISGISKFSARNANYDVANVAPTWSNSARSAVSGALADQTGTANDPKLVVTYDVPTFRLITLLGTAPV